jgi:hypothetical protein
VLTLNPSGNVIATNNVQCNNCIKALTSTTTAGSTSTLSLASTGIQRFTGTSAQTVQMPNGSTLPAATQYWLYNESTQPLTVQDVNSNTLGIATTNSLLMLMVRPDYTWNLAYLTSDVKPYQTVTTNTTITSWNQTIYINAASNAVAVTLPAAVATNHVLELKRIDTTSANAVTIVPYSGGQTIDGSTANLTLAIAGSTSSSYVLRTYSATQVMIIAKF